MNEFVRIAVEYDGIEYISEWDFEGIKKALEMNITEQMNDPISYVKTAFFCSVLKNHPYANKKKTDEFVDAVIQDEDYGLDAFAEITDAFAEGFIRLKGGKDKKKKKVFSAQKATVTNIPKNSK